MMVAMIFKLSSVSVLLSIVSAWPQKSPDQDHSHHEYDVLTMSIGWSPVVACEIFFINLNGTEITCSPCNPPKAVNKWIIHGLWPSKRQGSSPSQCSNIPYNSSLLSDVLKEEMINKWPLLNFNRYDSEDGFWAHEWNKHGTCALDLEYTNNLSKYFSKAVDLYDRFNIKTILDQAKIIPGKKYQSENIHCAFQKSLGVKAFLVCRRHKQSSQQFLLEVQICFDKSFALVDCEDQNPYVDNCTNEYEVTYIESC